MTKEQLQSILEGASKKDFLGAIEFLNSLEKPYRKSVTFKQTRIPLLQLFREYMSWKKIQENIAEQFVTEFTKLDKTEIVYQITQLIDYLLENEELSEKIMEVLNKFDLQSMTDYAKELDEAISKLKK